MATIRVLATGTPVSKSMTNLYPLFEYLDPDIIGVGDYYAFRNRYMVMGGYKNKEIIGYSNVDELMGFIEPYTFQCTKKEALPDLPDKTLMPTRFVKLPAYQQKMYDEVRKAQRSDISVKNVLEKALRLHQIVGGYVKNDEGKIIECVKPKDNVKREEMLNVIEEVGGQVVIWARFIPEIRMIIQALEDLGGGVSVITGATPKEERAGIVRAFQSGNNRFYVGTTSAGGMGIELYAASLTTYYSNTFTWEDRRQSEDRVHRDGVKCSPSYLDIAAKGTIDEAVLMALEKCQDLADFVRDAIDAKSNKIMLNLVPGL
jgi:SNF2 family DNA or RNA helicase